MLGDPGQFEAAAAGDNAPNGLFSACGMYCIFGPGECAIGLGFNGDDGIIAALGDGCGI